MDLLSHRLRVGMPVALVIVFALCAAGTTAAAWGIISDGDNGVPSARGAQIPIGENSVPTRGDVGGDVLGNRSVGGDGGNPPDGSPPNTPTVAAGGSGGGSSLPFTGFLAIPLLAAGSALLLGGIALRRRSAHTPA